MRLGVAATPDVAIPTLDWLLGTNHEISLVITQPDKPSGRGRVLKETIVSEWAVSHNIKVIKPASPLDLIEHLEGFGLRHHYWLWRFTSTSRFGYPKAWVLEPSLFIVACVSGSSASSTRAS